MDDSSAGLINPAPVLHERKTHRRSWQRHGPISAGPPPLALLAGASWELQPQGAGAVVSDSDGTMQRPWESSLTAAAAAAQQGGAEQMGEEREPIDALEVFEHLRDITDPEHPYTLEQLNVVEEKLIDVDDAHGRVRVDFTPTVAHCSMATLIGLSIRVKLMRTLPNRFKVDVRVSPGSHSSEAAVNKQLADKERVAAALENPNLLDMVNKCLASSEVEKLAGGA